MKTIKRITIILTILVAMFVGLIAVCTLIGSLDPSRQEQTTASVQEDTLQVVTPEEVEQALNDWRTKHGLHTFRTDNPVLDAAAQARAESMCAANDWTHDKAWQVLDQYYAYSTASENIHYDFLQEGQAANAIYGWEHSPGHLKTMLAEHSEASIGVKDCPGYQGMPTAVLIVNYFGNPR